MSAYIPKSKTDHWATPKRLLHELQTEFGDMFDPCPLNSHFDGLELEWKSITFLNPPHSQLVQWVEKAHAESLLGRVVVALLPARTDTRWFHKFIYGKQEIRFIKGRLRFGDSSENAPFPSMVVIFRKR